MLFAIGVFVGACIAAGAALVWKTFAGLGQIDFDEPHVVFRHPPE